MQDGNITAQSIIKENQIINTKELIWDDSKVVYHCHISTGAIINGGVTVGNGTFVGSNAVVRESVHIGENFLVYARSLFSGIANE